MVTDLSANRKLNYHFTTSILKSQISVSTNRKQKGFRNRNDAIESKNGAISKRRDAI